MICACAPTYPNADQSPAKGLISAVEPDGITLKPAVDMPKSALDGPPKFVNDGNLTPDFYAVNTMQPPYQPSANKPAPEGDPAFEWRRFVYPVQAVSVALPRIGKRSADRQRRPVCNCEAGNRGVQFFVISSPYSPRARRE